MKLLVGPEVALEYFEMLAPEWELFESRVDGDLTIAGCKFSMRVGLHMQRPTQAIMAAGQFVKLRSAGNSTGRTLKVLDPENPDSSLYGETLYQGKQTKCWHPNGALPERPEPPKPKFDSIIMDSAHFFNNLERFKK